MVDEKAKELEQRIESITKCTVPNRSVDISILRTSDQLRVFCPYSMEGTGCSYKVGQSSFHASIYAHNSLACGYLTPGAKPLQG